MKDAIPSQRHRRTLGGETVDRRNSERSILSAVAEVTEKTSKTKLAVRIGDLSLHGCYADSLSVFPAGTWVQICIRHAGSQLQAAAKVIYSKTGLGMGLSFEDLSPDKVAMLQMWTSGFAEEIVPPIEVEKPKKANEPTPRAEQHTLANLINLLMRKGLVTSTEGTEMLLELRKNF
jgi:hypothetical protein